MDLQSGFIFNRFGEEIETPNQEIDKKLKALQADFNNKAKTALTNIKDELAKDINTVKDNFTFTKNYISVKNKRIVSASTGVDKNDCITKIQLDAVTTLYSGLVKRVESLEKKDSNPLRKSKSMTTIPEKLRDTRSVEIINNLPENVRKLLE